MRVLQLSTYDGGQGAARATFRLHRALQDYGVDSTMRVAIASSGDAWVRAPRSKPRQALALLRSTASWWFQKPQLSPNPITHSVAALPSRLDRELNEMYADYQARVQRRSVAEISMANKDAPLSKKKVRSELRAAEEAPRGATPPRGNRRTRRRRRRRRTLYECDNQCSLK